MTIYKFSQVDVFTSIPLRGNPLAVVHDARGLTEAQMLLFAKWTNLSETTFLLPPTIPGSDYQVRIFTRHGELAFAGHPTLGSAYCWLQDGGLANNNYIMQQSAIGLVKIKQVNERLSFIAPPLLKDGPLEQELLVKICTALEINLSAIVWHQWVDNGAKWCAVMLDNVATLRALQPRWERLHDIKVGVLSPIDNSLSSLVADYEMRAFSYGIEDPITGSLAAGVAQYLASIGEHKNYVIAQGMQLGREGRIFIEAEDNTLWVGGQVIDCIHGQVNLD